ncbi:MAG TPA: chromosome segregation protein SMC [Candidatus Acidoferrales bacterium]|nr:chromosome segregation protein SMC [Candidatus Acidoferrales bacterium]
MLKLRKVELLGFKSFCEKTNIVFSGSGVTCIIGPNGCGKSNVVDAVSWVLGEQSHKMLRAERMSDCIFNGTAKRPPMGISEVSLTLVDPELAEAAAKVLGDEASDSTLAPALITDNSADAQLQSSADSTPSAADAAANEEHAGEIEKPAEKSGKRWKKRGADKPAVTVKPGEVVVGRRLYRSGQSEYLINGRVARLRDVQELFMGMGLGPDSYAIIEQGRIGQILNSRPMDRRALIEEAAGITVYKTKRRLAEAKLEAAKVNLSRVNDILVEVEKQLASLKRQASKARRYAELRDEMRGLMRSVLASKARHLEIEAERLESALSELVASESAESAAIRELEAEQERLDIRNYELEGELRQLHNLLNQAALELDRAENRIAFNREQEAQVASRISQLALEIAQAEDQAAQVELRLANHREGASKLRAESSQLDSHLQDFARQLEAASTEQISLDQLIASLRDAASRSGEDSVRAQVESLQAEDLAARIAAEHAQREEVRARFERESQEKSALVDAAQTHHQQAEAAALHLAEQVREAQQSLAELRSSHQQAAQRHETTRENLAAARARRSSLEQILNERAYTAEAVQKLFSASAGSEARGFRAVGVLADYAEVEEQYEGAVEQFLRDELEYVVVETFDHARAGIALLREEMGGRATFFVDSLRHLKYEPRASGPAISSSGVVSRLDNLVDFREPLGPAAKNFLAKLQAAYLIETSAEAEKLARENPEQYFVTLDGTCFHGRMVTGGRPGEAGPLALKRELRMHEAEAVRLERLFEETQSELLQLEEDQRRTESELQRTLAAHVEAEKARVSAFHQLAQARDEAARAAAQLDETCKEVAQLAAEAAQARARAAAAHQASQHALLSRTSAEQEAAAAAERLVALRQQFQSQQAELATRREEFAAMAERLANAETLESRLAEEANQSRERLSAITAQRDALLRERAEREASNLQLAEQATQHRAEKEQLEQRKTALESQWNSLRERAGALDADLRSKRDSFEQLRGNRNQREIEKARNDSDREHLRQTCVAEANAQPEELIAQQPQLLTGEELALSESNYLEKKERLESMGPVNMMALEEFQECDQRNTFLARERDDLVESIQNTQQAITELDTVSREKFEQAFNIINRNFSEAFRTLFGGGTGEMRLTEPDSSGDCGIDVVAQPPGKRLQNILLLSGGEKAMTALALLIAVFRFQPSPFCILDEVDAPLDEANVGRFNRMLMEMGEQTQFIIVTHNRKTMEMGSVLYGVTMQEPGVSKLVSVRWEEAAERAKSTAA